MVWECVLVNLHVYTFVYMAAHIDADVCECIRARLCVYKRACVCVPACCVCALTGVYIYTCVCAFVPADSC